MSEAVAGVLVGSPAAGTPVMEAVPLSALDLPLRAWCGRMVPKRRLRTWRPRPSRLVTTSPPNWPAASPPLAL